MAFRARKVFVTFEKQAPGEIITPGIIRMQAEVKAEENNQKDTLKEQQFRLGKLAHCLPPAQNTIIPHRVILKYPHAYQAHLEKVADFLLCGEGTWWRHVLTGVEFFYVSRPVEAQPGADTLLPLHHSRNHTLKSEVIYLQDKCVALAGVKIPHHTNQIIHTGFLQEDADDVDNDNEGKNDHDDCNEIESRSEDYAEEDSHDEEEETLVAVEQVGECLLDQDDQKLEEQLKEEAMKEDSTEDRTAQLKEPPTAVAHETNHCGDGQNLSTSSLSSALAKNVAKIIGETKDVRKLDKYRKKVRKSPNIKVLQEDYKTHLAHVQTQVLGKHSQVAKIFKEWEKQFTSTNDCLEPTLDDIEKDEKGYNLYKMLRLCRQLLKHWNITVHL
ncbi:uncharacterized protein [Montipora foliosa]|uniref:uncharacterized protein n=1 Tax=Montipora foliosa TaxID=591990 RepID=UPI0035F10900